MFIETRIDTINETRIARTFIKSSTVQAFPCGRRRSTPIEKDLNDTQSTGQVTEYRIPFDPEARLNTEANNRKHSSLNGYTQTYLHSWNKNNDNRLSMSIAGYLFSISLAAEYVQEHAFGTKVLQAIINKYKSLDTNFDVDGFTADNSRIYANIVVQDTKLFSGFQNYYTGVLQSQSPETEMVVLDLLLANADPEQVSNYYFSGLSFSVSPLTNKEGAQSERVNRDSRQAIFSLCILERVNDVWKICEAAKLPDIAHGDTEDSVKVGDLFARGLTIAETFSIDAYGDINLKANDSGCRGSITSETVNAKAFFQDSKPIPVAELVESTDDQGSSCWQLRFTFGSN